jgi:hypothetical protein
VTLAALIQQAILNTMQDPSSESSCYLRAWQAEEAIANYIMALQITPGMNPLLISEQVQLKRAEYSAWALRQSMVDMSPLMGQQIASAITSWLTAHSQGQYIPGTLVAGPNTVVPVPGSPAQVAMNFSG